MAKEVIKKDGSKEPFDAEKIKNSIRKAAQEAGSEEGKIGEIVEQVSKTAVEFCSPKEEIATSEIKEKILSELDRVEPSVSAAWRKYDEREAAGAGTEETGKATEETGETGETEESGKEESKEEPTV